MNPIFFEGCWRYAAGWIYKRNAPNTRLKETNCCIFTEMVMQRVFPNGLWSEQTHRDLMILDASRVWSPIDAVEAAGIGRRVDEPVASEWHLVQAWADAAGLKGGHTFFYFEPEHAPFIGAPFVAEATDARVQWVRESTLDEKLMYRGKPREYRMAVLPM